MDIVFATPPPQAGPLRAAIRASCREDETEAVARVLAATAIPAGARDRIAERARSFVSAVCRERLGKGGIDAFLHEYALSSREGGSAPLPCRGAPAHPRCGERRSADPRQDR